MKANVKVKKEVELSRVIVKAAARYWADYSYSEDNGETWVDADDDEDSTEREFMSRMPLVISDDIGYGTENYWNLSIDIDTGKAQDWRKGFCVCTHLKVCDNGLYQFVDNEGNVVWNSMDEEEYYVPNFLSLEENGYGDYIFIRIDGEGYIKDWKEKAIPAIRELLCKESED